MSESSQGSALSRLPPSTIKLISSTQVITSVSSVVKELMENSLDGGASLLEIHLDGHGLDRIEVKDNGTGIPAHEVQYMCQRSYTSKISDFSDLGKLSSYGFRGEALFSVCNVADVSVTTISSGDEFARTYRMNHNGEVVETKPANLDRGTSIVVTNLFKNLPVRKQFLSSGKRKAEEMKKVETIVKTLGLVNCSVKIRFTHNKMTIWQKAGVCSILRSLIQVLPPTIVKQLKEITYRDEIEKIEFTLLVPKLDCNIVTTCLGHSLEAMFLFVNQRHVREKQIEKVIQDKVFEFFGTKVPAKKCPAMLASISLPPDMIDINLEPNKTKVFVKDIEKITKHLNDQLSMYYYGKGDEATMEEVRGMEPIKRKLIPVSWSPSSKKPKKDSDEESSAEVSPGLNCFVNAAWASTEVTNLDGVENRAELCDSSGALEPPVTLSASAPTYPQTRSSAVVQNETGASSTEDRDISRVDSTFSCFEPDEASTAAVKPSSTAEQTKSTTISVFLEGLESRPLPSPEPTEMSQKPEDCTSKPIVAEDPFDLLRKSDNTVKFDNASEFFSDCWFEDPWNSITKSPAKSNATPNDETFSSSIEPVNEKRNQIEDLKEFGLSNWSRGDVCVNGKKLEGTTAVVGGSIIDEIDETRVSPQSSNRSVSSQMGQKGMSAFTKFARQMRVEIVKAEPGMSFPKIAKELSKRWQELQEEDRKTYEEMAAVDRLEKKNRVQTPKEPNPPGKKSEMTKFKPLFVKKYRAVVKVDVKLSEIQEHVKSRSGEGAEFTDESPGIIAHINDDLSLIKGTSTISVISTGRLNESVKFFNNLNNMPLELRVLEEGIEINRKDLGPLWDILETLDSGTDVNLQANQLITNDVLTDERIVKNGFRIEKIESSLGNMYTITDVAKNIAHFGIEDLREILRFISKNNFCRLRDCRPLAVVNFIRSETIRSFAGQSFPRTDYSIDLYKFWCRKVRVRQDSCPHYRPVAKLIFPTN